MFFCVSYFIYIYIVKNKKAVKNRYKKIYSLYGNIQKNNLHILRAKKVCIFFENCRTYFTYIMKVNKTDKNTAKKTRQKIKK